MRWRGIIVAIILVIPLWSAIIIACEVTYDGVSIMFDQSDWEPNDRLDLSPYLPASWTCLQARCQAANGIWSVPWRTHQCQ